MRFTKRHSHAVNFTVPYLLMEVSSVVRLLEFLGSTVRLDEASLADLERLKASMRRLASQLSAMQRLNPATLNP